VPAPLDRRILFLATVGGLPAVLVAEWVIWRTAWPLPVRILLLLLLLGVWIGCAVAARGSLVNPLHTLANLGIRQGDFPFAPAAPTRAIPWAPSSSSTTRWARPSGAACERAGSDGAAPPHHGGDRRGGSSAESL
jgi:hypothetical protein